MDDVEVEVVNTPIFELLLADGLDFVMVVEGIPKLGDKEEIFALDYALLDSTGDTLTRLDFIPIVCTNIRNCSIF